MKISDGDGVLLAKGMEILNSFLEVSIDKLREWER
jgi:hypothetical protein